MQQLHNDISLFNTYCLENNITGYVRLNGTSDIDWQKIKIDNQYLFSLFPNITFYDYTKDYSRIPKFDNYHLTYSYTETTDSNLLPELIQKGNVAVVFNKLPIIWHGVEVVNGDLNDLRPLDKKGVIVGLIAKGKAKKDTSGFVKHIA